MMKVRLSREAVEVEVAAAREASLKADANEISSCNRTGGGLES